MPDVSRVVRVSFRPLIATTAIASTLLLGACLNGDNGDDVTRLQGWTAEQRAAWYWGTQGSRLIPESWFDALEQPGSEAPFAAMENLTRFGFLKAAEGDSRRPIGFAIDRQPDEDLTFSKLRWYEGQPSKIGAEAWIGLNCAACHTARMTVAGQELTVDGGPNLLDFQSFIEALDDSMAATKADPAKWDRFAAKVLAGKDTPANRTLLERAFNKHLAWQDRTDAMNDENPGQPVMRYGFGRLDAVGHILNKILMFSGAKIEDGNPANAPVSYPFLWGIGYQEHVQWNGVARNSRFELTRLPVEYGALGRNTGEVLGVFGDIVLTPESGTLEGYKSSVRAASLDSMEQQLRHLESPRWPDSLPPIDEALRARGDELFDRMCVNCHTEPPAEQPEQGTERMLSFERIQNEFPDEMTDIWMACNAYVYRGPTGTLKNTKDINGNPLPAESQVVPMLATSVRGAIVGNKADLAEIVFRSFLGYEELPEVDATAFRTDDRTACLTATGVETLAYKARPLDGIWATAPYLHNGSVPTLYDLLRAPADRPDSFWTGNREFDPVKVGYITTDPGGGAGFLLETRNGTGEIDGNSAMGHDYGVGALSEEDRLALLEYLKSL